MKLGIVIIVLTAVLVAAGTIQPSSIAPATTPEGAVQALFAQVRGRDLNAAYRYVADAADVKESDFARGLLGSHGSLRTNSSLQKFATKVLSQNDDAAMVRADLQWSTAVGAVYESRDLKAIREGSTWKVEWPVEKRPNVPPQVIPVTFLRWDVIQRGAGDDWGAQNVEAPRVRIVSMNAVPNEAGTTVLGEIVNEDTVPAFVSVSAFLTGKDGSQLGEESSFDKISHTLLPKEVSPFRIDFPAVPLDQIKSVRMQPTALLVGASADPVIGVLHQRLETTPDGHHVLKGELLNESGETVNIPHVLATYYDDAGKVVWVSDGYVSDALLPQVPVPFALNLRDDVAARVNNYRVTVNQYSLDRQGQ
jgi:hypothetical protein